MVMLSDEQEYFIKEALSGKNILVDACIGSGKTTTIQQLCNRMPMKSILYLTYNKLLKLDAKSKIKNRNVTVQNYHGFAYGQLAAIKKRCSVGELIKTFNRLQPKGNKRYDVLILDEYQDIDDDIAKMLEIIKSQYPGIQLIAVGDMAQKIYDYTSLNVSDFIKEFLDDFERLTFSRCFRLNERYAKELGNAWNKPIIGVNEECQVEIKDSDEVYEILCDCDPKDILCLGARTGSMIDMLNKLERHHKDKFNKNTVYASIKETNSSVNPDNTVAIFTTFDSSKGMERDTCIVFDYDYDYWNVRSNMPNTKYEILRNIFLVAASRGKRRVIFCGHPKTFLQFRTVGKPFKTNYCFDKPFDISTMFDYKYREDIDDTYDLLEVEDISPDRNSSINVPTTDGLIDMSPCIGIFTEACYFNNYEIQNLIDFQWSISSDLKYDEDVAQLQRENLMGKIRYCVYQSTKQRRYFMQTNDNFVDDKTENRIKKRLSELLPTDCETQRHCAICGNYNDNGVIKSITINGLTDEINEDKIYELKFVSTLSREHFLQLATYMAATGIETGILWNIKDNSRYKIRINNVDDFLRQVVKTITKGAVLNFKREQSENKINDDKDLQSFKSLLF